MKKFSVLMTVYKKDNPEYFKMSLLSVLNQTVIPDEIIVVKDGRVSEALQNVINEISEMNAGLIREIQLEKNLGLGLALNEGLKSCKNELVARMDADDISLPTRFEKQLLAFENNDKLDIVGCPVKEFEGKSDNIIGKRDVPLDNLSIYNYAKRRDPFNHPTVMYKKNKIERFGPYRNYRKNQDTALWIDLLINECVCANIPEYLLLFRFDEQTYKKRKSWVNTKILIEIRWNSYKKGFNSFFDFVIVAIIQLGIYIMPSIFQKFIYKNILRK